MKLNEEATNVFDKIRDIERVVVVGTGFIGLPLALLLAHHEMDVVGVDIDNKLVDGINDASLNLEDRELQRLLNDETTKKHLIARTEPTSADAFVISVPTPLRQPQKSPDLSALQSAIDDIIPLLEKGNLINVESTVPPLTCEEVIASRLRRSGFTPGEDIQLAHSPERILPGNVFEEIRNNDRIIGGVDDASRRRAAKLYKPFLNGEIYFTDLVSAELCKLMENTYRDINVAIANEFALIAEELEVNGQEVIDLANNHPRVDILNPGIGVGGHCLPVDPWFLNEADPEHANLLTAARRINDEMPEIATQKIRQLLLEFHDPNILVLGLAYKPGTYDTRNSPAREIIEKLRLEGHDIVAYDRNVPGYSYDNISNLVSEHDPDIILQLVPHEETVLQLENYSEQLTEKDITLVQFSDRNRYTPQVQRPD